MKKLLSILIVALMLIGTFGCSNQGNKEPEEKTVKGEVHDVGRISILVPCQLKSLFHLQLLQKT